MCQGYLRVEYVRQEGLCLYCETCARVSWHGCQLRYYHDWWIDCNDQIEAVRDLVE